MNIEFLIKPFLNITQFLSAMQIVHATYCTKMKNVDQVAQAINQLLTTHIDQRIISQFIEKLINYPKSFGYDFIQNYACLKEKLIMLCTTLNQTSNVIDIPVLLCVFCLPQEKQLIVKGFRFNKEPVLYKDSSIGI